MALRYRGRRRIEEVVQTFDAFPKVPDKIREKGRVHGALATIFCCAVAFWLTFLEISAYRQGNFDYKYIVDVDLYTSKMHIDVDLVVAMPCSLLDTELSGALPPEDKESKARRFPFESPFEMFFAVEQTARLKLTPTKYELNAEEKPLWELLQKAQRYLQAPGQRRMRSLADINYIQNSVLEGLHKASESKMHKEVARLKEQGVDIDNEGDNSLGGHVQMLQMSGSMVRVIHFGSGIGRDPFSALRGDANDDSNACHIAGRVPVKKARGHVHIVAGRKVNLGFIVGRMDVDIRSEIDKSNYLTEEIVAEINFTHRIEHVGFGPRVPGLVVPLAGTERVTSDYLMSYDYYIKIVPTRLSTGVASTLTTYQYAVTHLQRHISHSEGSHGQLGIRIHYELTPLMVDISVSNEHSLVNTIIRICAAVGGIVATTVACMGWLNALLNTLWPRARPEDELLLVNR